MHRRFDYTLHYSRMVYQGAAMLRYVLALYPLIFLLWLVFFVGIHNFLYQRVADYITR